MANKRLIDADELISDVYRSDEQQKTDVWHTSDIEYLVMAQPTVDAVEVVRCKDCKHRTVTSDGMVCECALPTKRMQDYYIYGSTILARVEPDAFCSYGERKDNERKAD